MDKLSNKKKKLMLLGGSRFLFPVIEEAHKLNIHVITVDYLPDNEAHTKSDEYVNVSIVDKDAVLKVAEELKIDGVMAFACDPGVLTASYVAEKMGLPFQCSYQAACILQDKSKFRKFLADNGFNCPWAKEYDDVLSALKDAEHLSLPVIVKPVDSAGSKGVTKLERIECLESAVIKAFDNSITKKIIIEDFLDIVGYQSSTDMFTVDGRVDMPLFSDQVFDPDAENPYVPTVELWPTSMSVNYQTDLINQLNKLFGLLKCKNGLYNIECRVCSDGKAYLMEISPRGGGNHIALIQDMAYGTNYIENEIRNVVGMPLNLKQANEIKGHWCTYSLHPNKDQQGPLESLKFNDDFEVNHIKHIDLALALKPGAVIKPFTGANMSIGDVLLHFNSREELFDAVSNPSKWLNIKVNTMSGKRLAVFGANNITQEVMDFAHTHGITVLSVSSDPNAAMHKVSDEQYIMDSTDEKLMMKFFKEQKVDGILSCSAEMVIRKSVDFLAKTPYYYYAKPEAWHLLMNKQRFKEYSKQFGIKVTPNYRLEDKDIKFPVIVKPVDGAGSIGVTICHNREELDSAVKKALSKSPDANEYICEKCLEGDVFQLFLWRQKGKTYLASVSGYIAYDLVPGRRQGCVLQIYPAKGENIIYNKLYAPLSAMFDELGVEDGSCFFQGIIEDDIPYIFDTGFRLPGSMDYRVVKKEKGIDLIGCYIQHALTGKFGDDFSALETPFQHCCAVYSPGLKNGVIGKIRGLDAIANVPGVYYIHQYRKEGDEITMSGYPVLQDLCRIYIEAPDKAELLKRIQTMMNLLQVENEKGENMLRDYPAGWQDYFSE